MVKLTTGLDTPAEQLAIHLAMHVPGDHVRWTFCLHRAAQNQRESHQYVGPSIRLGDTLLQWTGPPLPPFTPSGISNDRKVSQSVHSFLAIPKQTQSLMKTSDSIIELQGSWATVGEKGGAMEPLDFRILLEGEVGNIGTSTLNMENCGTTVVYFSWNVGSHLSSMHFNCQRTIAC